jgi:carbamoyl-phosphate synthase small subunit
MPNGVIAHAPDGNFDRAASMKKNASAKTGPASSAWIWCRPSPPRSAIHWDETPWNGARAMAARTAAIPCRRIDYGVKRNILRLLAAGCKVTVVPATTPAEDILALKPDGVFLSNGPGDPAATGKYAVPVIRADCIGKPTFGICLGHQMLGLAVGATDAEDASGPPRRQPSGEGS